MAPQPRLMDLIDLEWLLLRAGEGDGSATPADAAAQTAAERELTELDLAPAAARQQLAGDRALRWRLCRAWLDELRGQGHALLGQRVQDGQAWTGRLLVLAGLLLGATSVRWVLAYDGSEPIGLWSFLTALVLVQVLLLALLIAAATTGLVRGSAWLGLFQRMVLAVLRSRPVDALLQRVPSGWRGQWRSLEESSKRLGARRPLYRDALRWSLFGLTQRFGVAFNAGAVLVFVWLVLFSDLAFCWSTTPAEVGPEHMLALTRVVAAPWAWCLPAAAPDAALVEATRWSRLQGGYLTDDATAAAAAGEWWPFLLAAVLAWGLLPRLLALVLSAWRLRVSLAAAALDHAGFQTLFERMLDAPGHAWVGPAPEAVAGAPPAPASAAGAAAEPGGGSLPCALVAWGGLPLPPEALPGLAAGRGWSAGAVLEAGGSSEEASRQTLEILRNAPPERVLVLALGGEPPDKRVRRFLAEARRALGETTQLLVSLLETGPDRACSPARTEDVDLWRRYLGELDDPRLRVEGLR